MAQGIRGSFAPRVPAYKLRTAPAPQGSHIRFALADRRKMSAAQQKGQLMKIPLGKEALLPG